jgi:uncharacterized protein YodC (DUF2158 family)
MATGAPNVETFEVGNVVRLKSGGPKMTVVLDMGVIETRRGTKADVVTCQWFHESDGNVHSGNFRPATLVRVHGTKHSTVLRLVREKGLP